MCVEKQATRTELYGDPLVFQRAEPNYSNPVTHTMREENFRKYIGRHGMNGLQLDNKKFSAAQGAMLEHAYNTANTIHVIGAYRNDLAHLLRLSGYQATEAMEEHGKKGKLFNNRRQLMVWVDTNGDSIADELWVLVFPSKEYVDQTAELIRAIIQDFEKSLAPQQRGVKVVVSHFSALEASIAVWTGFQDFIAPFIRHGDVCVIGNIDLLLRGLKDYDYLPGLNVGNTESVASSFTYGGLDNMFGVQIAINKHSFSRLVLIGVKESYWGSASAQYAKVLLEAGAKHLLYGSKAASIVEHTHVHHTYMPDRFAVVDEEGRLKEVDLKAGAVSELFHNLGISKVGLSVTVPTVIGEDARQREIVSFPGATCMDCENGHIAEVVYQYNRKVTGDGYLSKNYFRATFLPIHFITDYIYRNQEHANQAVPGLGHHAGNDDTVKNKRDNSFRKIGNVFSAYGLAYGVKDVRASIRTIHKGLSEPAFATEYGKIKPLLDAGLGREALAYLASTTDERNYQVVTAIAHLMTCQKSGYIDAAFRCLKRLKDPGIFMQLNLHEQLWVLSIEMKLYSQTGSTADLAAVIPLCEDAGSRQLLQEINQFGAMKRREAIYHSLTGSPSAARQSIVASAAAEDSTNARHTQTNIFFDLLSQLPCLQVDLGELSARLSHVRNIYLTPNLAEGPYQTNFEKSALAALFLEAAFYLSSKHATPMQKGAKILTIAHLLNLRLNGGIYSETYGEILACTSDFRVKSLLGFAMRTDDQAQDIFQRWVNSRTGHLPSIAREVNGLFQQGIEHREKKIQKLLQE